MKKIFNSLILFFILTSVLSLFSCSENPVQSQPEDISYELSLSELDNIISTLPSINTYTFKITDNKPSIDDLYSILDKNCYLKYYLDLSLCTGITELGNYEFASIVTTEAGTDYRVNSDSILGIILPDSITTLGDNVFASLSSITDINLPDNIKTIGSYCFDYCWKLKHIKMPANLENLGSCFIQYNEALETIEYPDNLTYLPNYFISELYDTATISTFVIPASIKVIGDAIIQGKSIREIEFKCSTVPEAQVGCKLENAIVFKYIPNLKTVTVPKGTLEDYKTAFSKLVEEGITFREAE